MPTTLLEFSDLPTALPLGVKTRVMTIMEFGNKNSIQFRKIYRLKKPYCHGVFFTKSYELIKLILENFNNSKEFSQWKLIKVTEKTFCFEFFMSFEIYLELCRRPSALNITNISICSCNNPFKGWLKLNNCHNYIKDIEYIM